MIRDEDKTKEQLINELVDLRQQAALHLATICKDSGETFTTGNERINSIFENTIVGIYQSSPEGRYITVNPAFAHIFGYDSPNELLNSVINIEQQVYVNTDKRTKCIQQILEHGSGNFEVQVYRKDGSIAWISNYIRVIRGENESIICFEGMAVDVTQRKKTEEELHKYRDHLKEMVDQRTIQLQTALTQLQQETIKRDLVEESLINSENKFKSIFSQSPIGIELYDGDGKLITANTACLDIFGIKNIEEVKGLNFFVDPNLPQEAKAKLLNGELVKSEIEFNFEIVKEMSLFDTVCCGSKYIDILILPFVSEKGARNGYLVQVQDITNRKLAEKEIQKLNQFLKIIIDNANVWLDVVDAKGNILIWNIAAETISGYSRKEVVGHNRIWDWLYPNEKYRKEILRKVNAIIQNNETVEEFETIIRTKNGEDRIISWYSRNLVDDRGIPIGSVALGHDITERKNFDKEIARLDQLHLVGEMAAGIGHEIRNPMTTVRGFLQMLGEKEECAKHKEYFDLMIDELDRANSIITDYLSLAKDKAIELKEQNLNSIINALFPLIQADAMHSDKCTTLELEHVPDLLLDEKEIRQLILNLARNGLEAMPPGGILTIRTFVDGKKVVLSIQDNGEGIKPEMLEKLGTPFFTTKDNGTGLGLAVCYSIAARHNAKIKVKSNSRGTTFLVRFKQTIPH